MPMTKKIRVAIIIWEDAIGGAERSLSDLADALDQQHFEMRFYYLSGEPGYFADQIHQAGFNTEYLKWKSGFDFAGRMLLLKKLKGFDPHIIHDHILPPLTRLFLKIFLSKPILNTEHGKALMRYVGYGETWRKFIEKIDFLFCDLVAANSFASAKALHSVYGLSNSKIKVVYLGINLNKFVPNPIKKTNPNLLKVGYLGRIINEHKGVDYLPNIAEHLSEESNINFKIIVAGDGPDRKKVENLCRQKGVFHFFEFLGWISDAHNFLQTIDILLIPSRYEPLGLTAIEALAMNVPVVAFDVFGLREILQDCEVGRLVPCGDTKKMAEEIYSYINNRECNGIGRKFVEQRFSNYKMAKQYEELYVSLVRNNK